MRFYWWITKDLQLKPEAFLWTMAPIILEPEQRVYILVRVFLELQFKKLRFPSLFNKCDTQLQSFSTYVSGRH